MNNSYYQTLNENFNKALELINSEFSYNNLINLLKNGNITEKQIAILMLDEIKSEFDANVIISNLTGQDGKIREAVSFKIDEFMRNKNYIKFFENTTSYNIFLDAIVDINANICRNIISALTNLRDKENFTKYFCQKLVAKTLNLLDIVEKFDFQDGKYKVNKEAFKLYWCLEAIYEFWDKIELNNLKLIITRSANINEYTIREKASKILTRNISDKELSTIKSKLKNDKNYYVRRYIVTNS